MKILCPLHEDTKPSMHVYPDGHCWCFVCNRGLTLDGAASKDIPLPKEQPAENLEASIKAIEALPLKEIRGLSLPCDNEGYYVLWPDSSYYKKRLFDGDLRYLAPRGHKQPLLKLLTPVADEGLVIVEGELNAMSLRRLPELSRWDVVSPGSAGNFLSNSEELVKYASGYSRVLIWVDRDTPGIKALWDLYPKLIKAGVDVSELTPELDANDLLTGQGSPGLLNVIQPYITKGDF